jgi:hypothetical protein
MQQNVAMFLFLAAVVVAVFAFLSIVAWVSAPSREREVRDRLALLKTLAEQPGENAARILAMLREQDEKRMLKREREERRGWITGGLTVMAAGAGMGVMLGVLGDRGAWTLGLIPFLIGCVIFGTGIFAHRG